MRAEPTSFSIEQLLRDDGRSLRTLAHALLHDEHAAADAVQEAALAALTAGTTGVERPGGWLRTLVRNFALKRLRGEARRSARDAATPRLEPLPTPLELAARAESTRRLVEAVIALDEPYRSTILLRYFEDLAPAEIARRERVAESTVRVRSMRALELLRARLDARHDGKRDEWLAALMPLAAGVSGGIVLMSTTKVAWISVAVAVAALTTWSVVHERRQRPRKFDLATIVAATPGGARSLETTRAAERKPLPPGMATVRGRVIDETDAPVGDARIVFAEQVVVAGERRTELSSDLRSGADGRFEIPGLHEGGELMVQAGTPRRVPAETKGFVRIVDGLELPPFVLRAGTTFEGAVVDLDGAPVAGARVIAGAGIAGGLELPERPPEEHPVFEVGQLQQRTTGEDGAFRLEGLVPDASPVPDRRGRVGVLVEHPDFASHCDRMRVDAPAEIVLGPRPEVLVRLSGELPRGVTATVVVDAFPAFVSDAQRGALRDGRRVLAATLAAGAMATAVPDSSPVLLRARAEVPGRPRVETFVRVEPGVPATIELAIPARSSTALTGRVVDAATGAPIAGARVCLPNPEATRESLLKEPDAPARATTDGAGAFTLPVDGGWAAPRVQHADYAPSQAPWIDLSQQHEPVEIALVRGATLKLVVRDDDGDPWSDRCYVFLGARHLDLREPRGTAARHDERQWFGSGAQSASDQRQLGNGGTLTWKNLPTGEYQVLLHFQPGDEWCGPTQVDCVLREGETRELELRATPEAQRAELSGTLLVNHEAVEGLKLRAVDPLTHANVGAEVELDDDGEFELELPADRRLVLVTDDPRHGGFSGSIAELVPLRRGEERKLALDVAWALFTGRVVDAASGRPIEGANVVALRGPLVVIDASGRASLPSSASLGLPAVGRASRNPPTDAAGAFMSGLWPAGPCDLFVSCAGYAPTRVDASFLERAPEPFEIALAPAGNELVIDAPPAPPDTANPHLDPWQVTVRAAAVDEPSRAVQPFLADVAMDGDRIVVRDLPAGLLTIVVAAYDWPGRGVARPAAARLALDLPASGRLAAAIDPPAGGDLSVLLLERDGSPALDAVVDALDATGAALPRIDWNGRWLSDVDPKWSTPPSGRFLLAALPAGPVRLLARFADGATAEASATVVAGRTMAVEIRRR